MFRFSLPVVIVKAGHVDYVDIGGRVEAAVGGHLAAAHFVQHHGRVGRVELQIARSQDHELFLQLVLLLHLLQELVFLALFPLVSQVNVGDHGVLDHRREGHEETADQVDVNAFHVADLGQAGVRAPNERYLC